MNIPNYENIELVEGNGYLTNQWSLILQQLISELQSGVGKEGFEISTVSSNPNSISPATAGGQKKVLQDSFLDTTNQNRVVPGTVIYDPYPTNTGTNGQLFVLLEDGLFHAITNT